MLLKGLRVNLTKIVTTCEYVTCRVTAHPIVTSSQPPPPPPPPPPPARSTPTAEHLHSSMKYISLAAILGTASAVCSPCYEKPPACTGSETSVQITGVTGDFCSPLCYQNQCPKGDGSFTATPSCVLETQGSSKPTQCALICTPGDDAACPAGASCQSIQGEGICTYPAGIISGGAKVTTHIVAPLARVAMEEGIMTVPSQEWSIHATKPLADVKMTVTVMMRHEAADIATLEETLYAVSTPSNPRYGKHLSLDELAALTPISAAKTAAVTSFFKNGGAKIVRTNPNADIVTVELTVAQAEALFATKIAAWQSATQTSLTLLRATTAYSLPADVAESVYVIGDLVGLPRITPKKTIKSEVGGAGQWPNACTSLAACKGLVTPAVLKQRYTVTDTVEDLAANAMASMAVAEFQGQEWDPTDLGKFSSGCKVNVTVDRTIGTNTPGSCTSNPNACVESLLDIEYIKGVSSDIPLTVIYSSGYSLLSWAEQISAMTSPPLVHSVSYGNDEKQQISTAFMLSVNAQFMKTGTRGISIFFASGDQGVCGRSGCGLFIKRFKVRALCALLLHLSRYPSSPPPPPPLPSRTSPADPRTLPSSAARTL